MEAGDTRAEVPAADADAADAEFFDVVVLGAGAGGAVVALEAKALGLKSAYVFEPPPAAEAEAEAKGAGGSAGVGVGADCCALALLRRAAALAFDLRDARLYGWAGGGGGAGSGGSGSGNGGSGERDAETMDDGRHYHDWSTLADAARSFAIAAAQRRRAQLNAADVTVLDGRAQRVGGGTLRVRGEAPEAERWLRAGALVVAAPPADGGGLVTRGAAALLARGRAPGRTLVIGSDTRSVEASAALAALGAQVTVLANEPELLPGLDRHGDAHSLSYGNYSRTVFMTPSTKYFISSPQGRDSARLAARSCVNSACRAGRPVVVVRRTGREGLGKHDGIDDCSPS